MFFVASSSHHDQHRAFSRSTAPSWCSCWRRWHCCCWCHCRPGHPGSSSSTSCDWCHWQVYEAATQGCASTASCGFIQLTPEALQLLLAPAVGAGTVGHSEVSQSKLPRFWEEGHEAMVFCLSKARRPRSVPSSTSLSAALWSVILPLMFSSKLSTYSSDTPSWIRWSGERYRTTAPFWVTGHQRPCCSTFPSFNLFRYIFVNLLPDVVSEAVSSMELGEMAATATTILQANSSSLVACLPGARSERSPQACPFFSWFSRIMFWPVQRTLPFPLPLQQTKSQVFLVDRLY